MPEVDWTRAKCRSVDPEMMYPPPGRAHKRERREAKAICRGRDGRNDVCPVREACRDWAVANGDYNGGIWGGLSDRERKQFALTKHDATLEVVRVDLVIAGRAKPEDARLHGRDQAGDRPRRANRKDAAGAGGRQRGAQKSGRAARQRTGEVVVLPTRRRPTNHGCPTARGVGEDAVAGDLRGRTRRPREVAALDTTARSSVRKVAVRRLRVVVDGDIA